MPGLHPAASLDTGATDAVAGRQAYQVVIPFGLLTVAGMAASHGTHWQRDLPGIQ